MLVALTATLAAAPGALPEAPSGAPAASPDVRAHHQLVHHGGEGRVYLIGGSTRRDGGFHYFDDVWTWSDTAWASAPPLPFPRSSHRVVYHQRRGSLILFGGGFGRAVRSEGVVWEHRDGAWRAVDGHRAAGASEPGMCYDAARDRVVLFGGWDIDGDYRGDTWEWSADGLARVDTTGPAPRSGHALVYDPVRQGCLLFGGRGEDGFMADTWLRDAGGWRRLDVAGPSPRWFFGSATDPEHGRVVIFGGAGPDAPVIGRDDTGDLADTWVLDGQGWRQLDAAGPPARSMAKLAFSGRGILLFGGRVERPEGFFDRNDTWELVDGAWERRE